MDTADFHRIGGHRGSPEIAFPGDAAYAEATQVFNLYAPPRPVAAVLARSVGQIRAAIGYAAAEGLPVRVHTTGHGAAAGRPLDRALLITTRLAGGVEVDPGGRVARVPAGTRWGEVVAATEPHGLASPHGSSATVGVVGYLLGGGMSFYGRQVGVAANSVRAIELVTADGVLRRVDRANDPELYWALRGGGGGFGVVTAVELELFPVAGVVTGAAFWPAEQGGALASAWQRWAADAPDEVTTSLRLMNLPPVPGVPPVLAAGPVLCVDGAVIGPAAGQLAGDLLGPLRAVGTPLLDTWGAAAPADVLGIHLDPAEPVPFVGDHLLLGELGEDGVAEFVRVTGPGSGSPLVIAGLRQLGGAYARSTPGGGVLDHFAARYSYSGSGVPVDPATEAAVLAHCGTVRAALAPWDTGLTAPTFVEHFAQPQRHLDEGQMSAVDRVRARVDPDGRFRDDIAPGASARS
jgi:FAD/FMN-containing dehydrogenase